MNKDILKQAVDLADGWGWYDAGWGMRFKGAAGMWCSHKNEPAQHVLDALAAQLVRQHIDKYGRVEGTVEYEKDPMKVIEYVVNRMH